MPARPSHITGEARKEWDRITEELDAMGLLTTTDRPALALYCTVWARWRHAEQEIAKLGMIVAAPKTKTPMLNPWLSIANKAHEQMLKLLAEYGLTPQSRHKIKVSKDTDATASDDLEF